MNFFESVIILVADKSFLEMDFGPVLADMSFLEKNFGPVLAENKRFRKKFGPGLDYSCMNKLYLYLVHELKKSKTANAVGRHKMRAFKSLHITSFYS